MNISDIRLRIIDEIESIDPLDAVERRHKKDSLAWVKTHTDIFRIKPPDHPPKHLVSYFVVVDPDHRSILLGDHIKAQLWLPPGGHVELNEHPRDTVYREAKEELGINAVFLRGNSKPLFITQTTTVGLTPGHIDVSLWYVLRGNVHDKLAYERAAFTDMAWFTLEEIASSHPAIFDPHMQRFVRKLSNYL